MQKTQVPKKFLPPLDFSNFFLGGQKKSKKGPKKAQKCAKTGLPKGQKSTFLGGHLKRPKNVDFQSNFRKSDSKMEKTQVPKKFLPPLDFSNFFLGGQKKAQKRPKNVQKLASKGQKSTFLRVLNSYSGQGPKKAQKRPKNVQKLASRRVKNQLF